MTDSLDRIAIPQHDFVLSIAVRMGDWRRVVEFAALAVQLFLLAILISRFNLESAAFVQLTYLVFGGFVVHYFLPWKYRLPFFLALSLVGIVLVLGWQSGIWLIGIGLGILGVCHLPVPFRARVFVLVGLVGLLIAMRAGWVATPWPVSIWPILASMFAFRLIVYLYDLRYQTAPVTALNSLSYFFMLPNVCFPLFPVVDYQSFCRNYYDDERINIHQVGVRWIFRGAVHLILYRIIYQNWSISAYDVQNAGDLVHYCLWSFLLYLRVSGEFHIVVGMLHLFGFNLAETHHLYYLSSSFTDFWRRINIYWKDFMMKVFFYPVYFRLRRRGPLTSLVISTLVVFFVTWFLHAVLWYWLRGTFLLATNDLLFWGILAVLVVINSVWEMKRGRQRTATLGRLGWKAALITGLKTLATFIVICILWSMWTTDSFALWLELWRYAWVPPDAKGWFVIGGAVLAICGGAIMVAREMIRPNFSFFEESAIRCCLICVILACSISFVYRRLGYAGELIAEARSANLNQADRMDMEQGYYEGLLAVDNFNSELANLYRKVPREWVETIVQAGFAAPTNDFQRFELKPSMEGMFKGALFRTNRWAMHDKDYSLQAPAGTYRIAMLGASISMGTGVETEENFEALVEDRLNREHSSATKRNFEILNFSVWLYRPIHQIKVLEEKVLPFQPNAIFYIEHPGDRRRLLINLAEAISQDLPLPDPFLRDLCSRAGVDSSLAQPLIRRRLQPYTDEIFDWLYERLIQICDEHHIKPYFVSVPPLNPEKEEANVHLAKSAGFEIIDLKGVYDGVIWWNLCVSKWDFHPTPEGHRMLADRLYSEILEQEFLQDLSLNEPAPTEAGSASQSLQ